MSSRKLKIGVVGVGALGRFHTKLYREIENVELVGIYDVNVENVERISTEFNVPIFPTIESLAEACEALSIAVPATMHHQVAVPLFEDE